MNKEFEASLKSVETENVIDLYFYRRIGYSLASALRNTGITPNAVTALSIFVGVASGVMFFFNNICYGIIGILLLIFANILDCVDGQLARITGIKSEFGRILDGIAGDLWFLAIYVCLALRLTFACGNAWWWFLPALMSGLSHLLQANITDYYKTVHLYFVSPETTGHEFQSVRQVGKMQQAAKSGLKRFFFSLYMEYTGIQERLTPYLQGLLEKIRSKCDGVIPDRLSLDFRARSHRLMRRCIDFMTFNGRTVVLFAAVLTGYVWAYFVFEIIVLNIILYIAIRKHEKMCKWFSNNFNEYENRTE
ncbi:MAG: CDP-alcohol phosphatidyltransferase family protein [Tannerella sp.]|jgi:hypothetical protein|nr:CDP-alcohol phosphatidyltransferase family protein [Tannerella sp.]